MIRPYLSDMINNYKAQEVWKVHEGNKSHGKLENSINNENYFFSLLKMFVIKFVKCILIKRIHKF